MQDWIFTMDGTVVLDFRSSSMPKKILLIQKDLVKMFGK